MASTATCAIAESQSLPADKKISPSLLAIAIVAGGALASPVLAAEPAVNDPGITVAQGSTASPSSQTGPVQQAPPVAGSSTGGGASEYTVRPTPPPGQNPYAQADQLKVRGWTIPLPGAAGRPAWGRPPPSHGPRGAHGLERRPRRRRCGWRR